jgi:hypothetical protein
MAKRRPLPKELFALWGGERGDEPFILADTSAEEVFSESQPLYPEGEHVGVYKLVKVVTLRRGPISVTDERG